MNGLSITPFRGLHLLLLFADSSGGAAHILAAAQKPEARRSRLLIGMCLLILRCLPSTSLSLSMDAAYIRHTIPMASTFSMSCRCTQCNINLFLIPIGLWKRNRSIMGFSFFVAPPWRTDGAAFFPEPLFSGFSLFLPRIFGYYVTHAILVVCGLSLATLGFLPPRPKDIPRILKTFWFCLPLARTSINLLLRSRACPEANYFFTYGAEIGAQAVLAYHPGAAAFTGCRLSLIACRLYVAVCALARLARRRGRSVFFINRTQKSGLGRDELPSFFGGWQLNAAGRFIGQSASLLRPQDIRKGGLRPRREGNKVNRTEEGARAKAHWGASGKNSPCTACTAFIFRLADANGDVDLARALHDHPHVDAGASERTEQTAGDARPFPPCPVRTMDTMASPSATQMLSGRTAAEMSDKSAPRGRRRPPRAGAMNEMLPSPVAMWSKGTSCVSSTERIRRQ